MDSKEHQRRLDLLTLARKQLNDEYTNQHSGGYSKWVAESNVAWRTSGIKLPLPAPVAMPTEAEVVARALQLYNAATVNNANVTEESIPATTQLTNKIQQIYATPLTMSEPGQQSTVSDDPQVDHQMPIPEPVNITAQLQSVYQTEYNIAMAKVTNKEQESDPEPDSSIEIVPVIDPIRATESSTKIEPVVDSELTVEADPAPIIESEAAQTTEIEFILPTEPEITKVQPTTSGIKSLIAKLLKTEQKGTANV